MYYTNNSNIFDIDYEFESIKTYLLANYNLSITELSTLNNEYKIIIINTLNVLINNLNKYKNKYKIIKKEFKLPNNNNFSNRNNIKCNNKIDYLNKEIYDLKNIINNNSLKNNDLTLICTNKSYNLNPITNSEENIKYNLLKIVNKLIQENTKVNKKLNEQNEALISLNELIYKITNKKQKLKIEKIFDLQNSTKESLIFFNKLISLTKENLLENDFENYWNLEKDYINYKELENDLREFNESLVNLKNNIN